uniref:AB hydrolase-1 domain-containing protein n=1 Tax=Ananas comosus var. bracteatus TaxID=296719 RepID=A0A6V7NEE3_ANACO|nr:unnamed protein product [Ananas comosus var. bracteatus]
MPNRNVVSWNTLLDGFVKSGDIDSAYEVFDAMPERNVVSWNSMIAGFVKNDLPREALMLFIEMMVCGLVPDEYTMASVISAISDLGLLDLGRRAHGYVFVVGHDWGALIAWTLCIMRPDRVKALVNTSLAHLPRDPSVSLVHHFKHLYGDNYYICRFQVQLIISTMSQELNVLREILTMRNPHRSSLTHKDWGSTGEEIALPSWLSEEDLDYYASKFEKTGFTGGMNYYRCLNLNWELTAPWAGAKIQVPTKFIVGDLDLTYHYPNIQDYMHKGGFKNEVPLLEEVVVLEGVGHFIQQERAEEVTDHIYNFIKKFQ